jgi:hypothetical protein
MTRLEKALAVLATVSPADLPERWAEVSTGTAPSVPTPLLLQLLAQWLQEKRHGGLPLMVVRELERVVSVGRPMPEPARKTIVLTPGTRLIRGWNGRTIAVDRSLSEIAKMVTGAHWPGPRFFGLNRRG